MIHETAHKVDAQDENGEDNAENHDNLPRVVLILRDEGGSNSLVVFATVKKSLQVVKTVSEHVLTGRFCTLNQACYNAKVVYLGILQVVRVCLSLFPVVHRSQILPILFRILRL